MQSCLVRVTESACVLDGMFGTSLDCLHEIIINSGPMTIMKTESDHCMQFALLVWKGERHVIIILQEARGREISYKLYEKM